MLTRRLNVPSASDKTELHLAGGLGLQKCIQKAIVSRRPTCCLSGDGNGDPQWLALPPFPIPESSL